MVDLPLHVGPALCCAYCSSGVRNQGLVLDSRLVVCLTACPSPGQGEQMALYKHPPMTRHPLVERQITTATPYAFHTYPRIPIRSVGDPARYMSGTRRQAPTRVSTPTPIVVAGWGRLRGTAVKVPGPKAVVVLAKCNYWARAPSEPARGSQPASQPESHVVEVESL